MGNPTIQRLYSDRERVIVYEPLYREPFVEGMKSRIRIVKASSGPYSRPTWKSIRRGEHLGSESFNCQISHMKFLEVITDHPSQEVERVVISDPDQEVYRSYYRDDGKRKILEAGRLDDLGNLKDVIDNAMDIIRNSQPTKVYHTPEEIINDEDMLESFR